MNETILRRISGSLTLIALALLVSSCQFDNPQALSEDEIRDPSAVQEVSNGVAAAFADGYGQTTLISDLAGDAVIWTGSETGNRELDRGVWLRTNNEIQLSFDNLVRARWTADNAIETLEGSVSNPGSNPHVARSHLLGGFSLILLGDHYSTFTMDGGAARPDAEAYTEAIDRLTSAVEIAQSAGETELAAAAMGGRARAHHALSIVADDPSELDAARSDAEAALALSPDFEYTIQFGRPARANPWWAQMQDSPELGVARHIKRLTDPVSGSSDPRVPVSDFQGFSSNGQDSLFFQQKYPTADSDIPLVKWQEMELIVAEHEWRNGDPDGARPHINAVRSAAGLPDFQGTTSTEVRDQLVYERLAEFAFEGRRWPDSRRFSDEFGDIQILPDDRWVQGATQESVTRKWSIPNTECQPNTNLSC